MAFNSSASNVIVKWTQNPQPDLNEVWRSIDGAAFSLLSSPVGQLSYNDTNPVMASGEIRCYEVRGVNSGIPGGFSNVGCALNEYIIPGTFVNEPTWMLAFGDLSSEDSTLLVSLELQGLLSVSGTLFLDATFLLTNLNLDSLIQIGGDFLMSSSESILGVIFPSLTTVVGDILFDSCLLLENVSIPVLVFHDNQQIHFDNCALDADSVNHILARGVASNVTGADFFLDGGTNAAPTGQGVVDKATLIGQGNTVTTN